MMKEKEDHCGKKTVYTCQGLKGDKGDTGVASGLFKEAVIHIPFAEMRQLHLTPKELLPNDITKGYNIQSIVLLAEKNGTIEYTYVGASPDFALEAILQNAISGDVVIFTGTKMDQIVATYGNGLNLIASKMIVWLSNPAAPEVVIFDGAVSLRAAGEWTLGDSDFTVIVTYRDVIF